MEGERREIGGGIKRGSEGRMYIHREVEEREGDRNGR